MQYLYILVSNLAFMVMNAGWSIHAMTISMNFYLSTFKKKINKKKG